MGNKIAVLKDISYGEHERNKIDIYIPETPVNRNGLILMIHGGGWHSGDKSMHSSDAKYWSELGFICASLNYRFVAENVSVYDELNDITFALEKTKDICKQYGNFIDRVMFLGASAGAHLLLLYALKNTDISPLKPVAAICYAPPVDLSKPDFCYGLDKRFDDWKYGLLSHCCGAKITKETFDNKSSQKALKNISPINYITDSTVPVAVIHGKADELIPYNHILSFVDILEKYKVHYELVVSDDFGHEIAKDKEAVSKAREIMSGFLEEFFG